MSGNIYKMEDQQTKDNNSIIPKPSSTVIKKAVDLQRMKLEKLMKNPEKPAFIPDMQKDKKFPDAPEFVRNVMGSSAGAGSGEFHVYRHIRRREYSRNLHLQVAKEKNLLDEEYHNKLEQYKREADAKTAKKREKRQRYKLKKKLKVQNKNKKTSESETSEQESEPEEEGVKNIENGGKEQEEVEKKGTVESDEAGPCR